MVWKCCAKSKSFSTDKTDGRSYNYLDTTSDDIKGRVNAIMNTKFVKSDMETDKKYENVLQMSGKLFSGVRFFFVKMIRSKLNCFFLSPMYQTLGVELMNHFRSLSTDHYEAIFQTGIVQLKERLVTLEMQLAKAKLNKDKFRQILYKFQRVN